MKTKLLTLVTLAFIGLSTANAQVGIGTNDPENTAALDVEATDKGFLPPRMSETERDDIADPATGLAIYNTDADCVQFYTGATWYNLCDINLVTPSVYSPSTGQIWMDKNLGASQVATASDDAAAYGDLYQWGRDADGHEDRNLSIPGDLYDGDIVPLPTSATESGGWDGLFITRSTSEDWLGSPDDNLWEDENSDTNPCPSDYRLPTEVEWEAEINAGGWTNADDAYSSPLKLTVGGKRSELDGNVMNDDAVGLYWTSSVSAPFARRFRITASAADVGSLTRSAGLSVRCIQKEGNITTPPGNPPGTSQTGAEFNNGFENNTTCANKTISLAPCSLVFGASPNPDPTTVEGVEYDWADATDATGFGIGAPTTTRALVEIGGQCWAAFNSNVPSTNPISADPTVAPNVWGDTTEDDEGYWGYYNTVNFDSWETTEPAAGEGLLYQWSAAMNGATLERSQGACPGGWHIPSDCEWMYLEHSLGMTVVDQEGTGNRDTGNVGSKLSSQTSAGTNDSGFSDLLAGYRNSFGGAFTENGTGGAWWSSTQTSTTLAHRRYINSSSVGVNRGSFGKGTAHSVRCLLD